MDRQLFVLGPEIWSSIDKEEIIATAKSMRDADIYNYPYDEFDISAYGKAGDLMSWIYKKPSDPDVEWGSIKKNNLTIDLHFRYYNLERDVYDYSMGVNVNGQNIYLPRSSTELLSIFKSMTPEEAEYMNDIASDALLATLLVMLATRNIEKEILINPKRYKDPSSKNGIKQLKNNQYKYITTIKIGKIIDTMRSGDARGPVRPHLRRGHLRNQRVGEGRKDVRQIFIQPVFVNADDGWIENQRKEYRVKL